MVRKRYRWIPAYRAQQLVLKCISGVNLSPANKSLFIISFVIYLENKIEPAEGILVQGVFIPKLLNYPPASCSLINPNFSLLHILHFDKVISFSFISLCNSWVFTICFFLYSLSSFSNCFLCCLKFQKITYFFKKRSQYNDNKD